MIRFKAKKRRINNIGGKRFERSQKLALLLKMNEI